ncbi:MAG: branched-chain amino acid ABC transporter permease [Armatimonadota bacterium]|nr:branched-chain amino acid ABC transporter permease [Armatimonadota bacterium]MDR7463263.1 branched-chain amino acid ABC transporter permease [Armatimonadota bacterium]MDR7469206.1 branched-chain amino acid ABC transporter permease [Armatimonadota bacterium]MDR7474729.1 branched-chain amino acid ABC transporter permease [Armatimonadota bacterium]
MGVVLLLGYPFVLTAPFPQHLMIRIFLFAALAQAWNILGGYCGQISLGHAVFFGIGAYASTMLLIYWHLSPWLGMLAGVVLSLVATLVIGYPTFRLRGHYFAIATIAVGEIARVLVTNWPLAGGAVGLYVPLLRESLRTFEFHTTKVPYYYISLLLFVAVTATTSFLEHSRAGYYFRAIKADPDAARSLGIPIHRYKLLALALSAAFTAVAGSFYAQYVLYIDPESVLPLMLSVIICLVAVLGGVGSLWGPLLGAVVLIPLSEGTRVYLAGMGGAGRAFDLIVYGAMIVLMSVFEPTGLVGLWQRARRAWR